MSEKKNAVCKFCSQPMDPGRGCTLASIAGYKRLPCSTDDAPHGVCHDCNVKPGQYHHLSCDMDKCPMCVEHQAFVCDCLLHHRIEKGWGWQGSRDELHRQLIERDGGDMDSEGEKGDP